jgi:hypothetical protein
MKAEGLILQPTTRLGLYMETELKTFLTFGTRWGCGWYYPPATLSLHHWMVGDGVHQKNQSQCYDEEKISVPFMKQPLIFWLSMPR